MAASERIFESLALASPVGIFRTDPDGRCEYANRRWCEIAGMSEAEAMGEGWARALHPEDRERVFAEWSIAARKRLPFHCEYRFQRPDGAVRWVIGQSAAIADAAGSVGGHMGTLTDITDLKDAELALRIKEVQLERSQRMARIGYWVWRADLVDGPWYTGIRYSNTAAEIFGVAPEELEVSDSEYLSRFVHPGDRAEMAQIYGDDRPPPPHGHPIEYRIVRADGKTRHLVEIIEEVRTSGDIATEVQGMVQDVTERKQIELAMQALSTELIAFAGPAYFEAAARRLRTLLDVEFVLVNRRDPSRPGELRTIAFVMDGSPHPGFSHGIAGTPCADALSASPVVIPRGVRTAYPTDGFLAEHGIEACATAPLVDHAGRLLGHLCAMSRKPFDDAAAILTTLSIFAVAIAAEIAHERDRQRYEDLFESAPDGLVMTDRDGRIALANRQVELMFGWTRSELIGQPVEMLVPPALCDSHARLREAFQRAPASRAMATGGPALLGLHKDRGEFPVEIDLTPVESEDGTLILAAVRDVTARHALEAQLRRMQKMDAIGRLTGGLAHDFNNYLAIVIGNLDLVKEHGISDVEVERLVDAALGGALRSAQLTNSLLAFSRNQALDPQVIDVNERMTPVVDLLKRTLGANIAMSKDLSPDLWPVKVDSAQLDSSIVNLATNARDAMPRGGTLSISTRNVHLDEQYAKANPETAPGDFVLVEISDTGIGMASDTAARAFEPFFTTKGPGHGTGLGLSMVYGFVKQSGGHINIYSEAGQGTAVRIYLPRDLQAGDGPADGADNREQTVELGRDEIILLVEDNDELRQTVTAQLESLGYRVIEAENGDAALRVLEQGDRHIDLLFTDVVMPGTLDGYEVARRALQLRPGIRALLTSGFPGDTLRSKNLHAPELNLLGKPYRKDELARAIRKALDARPAGPAIHA